MSRTTDIFTTKPPRAERRAMDPRLGALIGLVAVVAFWWISADTYLSQVGVSPTGEGGSIPSPVTVVSTMLNDGAAFYAANVSVTLTEAIRGYAWGNGLAVLLAAMVVLIPRLEGLVMQIAVLSYCIPLIAIGPIISIVVGPPPSGDPAGTAVFLAAMLVFFTTVIGALLGLKAADTASLEIVTVYGGGRWKQLVKVRLFAALPSLLNSLKIAAPAAFLGAIIGEYLGGVDAGIGPALVNAQQGLLVPRAWGLALAAGLVSGFGYFLVAVVSRFVVPWAPKPSKGNR
ncbi:ABC-type nitrate/sulfonate/bicarbonate transport system permease component [Glaciihabitans tibetensis]|uniref:ABC-type nitrate/sulfonate/bicarbonate transport system permease component n=1 Tax=Glaciihabitans tibetensis TaxID=1266600 RepID=A0A2T0VJX0_9MICO|nr:ABC transporter permease subunit [Glaciihabitans tibetensis]PRY70508.1 ABC-type nitrate/sulfonate/bicarbonate transport system permease component [Glaciihabitans tibetensis]